MTNLSTLSPSPLWQFFAEICAIPHPSYHEEALAQYIVKWAQAKNLFVERDTAGNILMRKAATAGMEKLTPVVLQAHLDMVPQKNEDTQHDFSKDPIRAYVDGEWVKAKGTTLGADNGIGMASTLAILADEHIAHGPLEVLLTMTEETGLVGASALLPNWLQGKMLINTDGETDGDIYTGCAGGVDAVLCLNLQREADLPKEALIFHCTLSGLKGGHSGGEIHLGLANANKQLARFLDSYAKVVPLQLIDFNGGTLNNAIPREAVITIAIPTEFSDSLQQYANEFLSILKEEYAAVEPNIRFNIEAGQSDNKPLTKESQLHLIALANSVPNGVMRMSTNVEDVVETSLNVAIITTSAQQAIIHCLIRSLIESGKMEVVSILRSLATLSAADIRISGDYPGWAPDNDSTLLSLARETYQTLFQVAPNIKVVHAGLECGLFKKPYPEMEMVSFGPTIRAPHSPDERVNIASVERYWQFLTTLLKSLPEG